MPPGFRPSGIFPGPEPLSKLGNDMHIASGQVAEIKTKAGDGAVYIPVQVRMGNPDEAGPVFEVPPLPSGLSWH